ncbi:MAG: 3-dehydroquinate synthase [Peptostreptococcaceae bacterium]
MINIKNEVCNIFINDNYDDFNKSLGLNDLNEKYDKVVLLTDENVYKHQLDYFREHIKAKNLFEYVIPAGENSKSLETYEILIKFLTRMKISRKSLIIAFGGGVVGDLGGFLASTYMRGIDFIQVPTTLLSMIDSSVGGKTAINTQTVKNIIGSFYRPKATYINISSLNTLDYDEFLSGISEVIKYGVICDYDFLIYVKENRHKIIKKDYEVLSYIIKKSVEIKAQIVLEDEFENGIRKYLNFGHTFGHSLEKNLQISHGYAVSIGMCMAFTLSLDNNLITKDYFDEFIDTIKEFCLPYRFFSDEEDICDKIFELMKNDKKNSFDNINLILPADKSKVLEFNNLENITEIIRKHKG